jgi:hypothetical protein
VVVADVAEEAEHPLDAARRLPKIKPLW